VKKGMGKSGDILLSET
jgi:hypothetical protein